MGELIEAHRPDLVVIACNTASTLVLPHLRARFRVPFVGTVPAIKPACARSLTKRVTVLGTQATVSREYTRALIRDFANGSDIALVGSAQLAAFAEAELTRRAGRRPPDRARDRTLLRRSGRPAHRYDRARLHAFSAPARAPHPARTLAGDLHRSRARDRAAGRRFERAEGERGGRPSPPGSCSPPAGHRRPRSARRWRVSESAAKAFCEGRKLAACNAVWPQRFPIPPERKAL